jgi:hypothetical protein
LHATELKRSETSGVDDDIGLFTRVAEKLGLVDVSENTALYDNAVLEALAEKPGEVDGCVDADSLVLETRVVACCYFGWMVVSEVVEYLFEPWVFGVEMG